MTYDRTVKYFRKWGIYMAVIRVQKTTNYTVMSNHHLRNNNMTLKAKGLMSLMLSLPPEWDYSVAGLASICKEGMTAVRSALKELEENQYLVRERRNSEKGYFVYEYTLYEIPDLSCTENGHTVNTHAQVVYTENRTQLNKEELNKKELNKKELNKETEGDYMLAFQDILKHIEDIELRNLFVDYVEMRRITGSPVTQRGLSMIINRCARLANFDRKLQKEMLEAAIINNWKSVYLPKEIKEQGKLDKLNELKEFYEE